MSWIEIHSFCSLVLGKNPMIWFPEVQVKNTYLFDSKGNPIFSRIVCTKSSDMNCCYCIIKTLQSIKPTMWCWKSPQTMTRPAPSALVWSTLSLRACLWAHFVDRDPPLNFSIPSLVPLKCNPNTPRNKFEWQFPSGGKSFAFLPSEWFVFSKKDRAITPKHRFWCLPHQTAWESRPLERSVRSE